MEKIFHQRLGLLILGLFICCMQTEAMRPNCSAITSEEKVGCVMNTNATVCGLLGCCWNAQETNKTLRCFNKRGGTCMPYRGRICSLSVNNSLPEYAHTPRFFYYMFGLFGTEQFLVTVTGVINNFVTDNEKCRYILLNMFCQFTLQPCYADNTVIEYCKEDCEAIFDECSGSLNQVIGAMKLLFINDGIDFIHTGLPDCSKYKPQEYFKDKPGLTCIKTGFFTPHNNCSESNENVVSCGPYNSTRDQCLGWGCCWNSSLGVNSTQCYGVAKNKTNSTSSMTTTPSSPPGICLVYSGRKVCDEWLNFTMLEYRYTPRFVDLRFGLNGTEKVIIEFMKAIDRIDGDQQRCKRLLKVILCEYVLPPCNDRNERYYYCREDCEAVFAECDSAMREMLGAAKYILKELGLEFAHVGVPNCTKLRFSDAYEAENGTCIHWGLLEFTPSPKPPPGSSKIVLIAGSVAGFLSFLLIIAIISFVCKKRKRKQERKINTGFAGVTFTAVSIRDRIKAESIRALDESKILTMFNPDDMRQIPLSSIEYIRDLGSLVFLGRAYGVIEGKEDAELLVAVKTLKEGSSSETKGDFFKEVALMSLLHHGNIVELLAVSTEEEPYGMIFEFMELGDLNQYLRRAGPFFEGDEKEKVTLSQDDLLSIALQCASGMEHLQMLRFVHRDVATRNCLVGTGMIVKISDFGMSRDIYASDYYKVDGQAVSPIRWMPPEALLLGKFTVESDIYSFGILLWEIYTLALQPYYGYTNEEVVEFIKKGVHLGQPDDCPDYVYQVMKCCWHKDASQRPNFTLIIAQLKQGATSSYDLLDSAKSPVHDKQPLYQNIGVSLEMPKKEEPTGNQPERKISQQAVGTPKSEEAAKPSYMNVNCNPGYLSDDEDMGVEEVIV